MKKFLLLYIISFFPFAALLAQNGLKRSLDTLLCDTLFDVSDASLVVYDLTDKRLLYEHRGRKILRPASALKLLTSVAALDFLGNDYTIDTELCLLDGGCKRNLYVRGGMDPLFDEQDIVSMASSLAAGTVVDTLFADCSMTDSLYWGPGWSWDDNPYAYQPYLSPLMLCGGAVEVVVTPSSRGAAPEYSCTPQSSFYTVVNEAVCGDKEAGKLTILRDWLENSNVIRIRGNCEKQMKERLNMYKSADFFIAVLVEKLDSLGIEVRNISFGKTPETAERLFLLQRPIEDVVDEALMESDNLCAEALLYHLAAADSAEPVSMAQGAEAVTSFVRERLGYTSGYSIADGSGLSLYNYITAELLLSVLRYAYEHPEIEPLIYNHLPLSGVSGTMKNRTKGSAAYKRVRAKTGTVKGVCTLAGYVQARNGHRLAFVIMNTGAQVARDARLWQDKVLDRLCR